MSKSIYEYVIPSSTRKRRRSDSVLWQSPYTNRKIRKTKDNTQMPPKTKVVYWIIWFKNASIDMYLVEKGGGYTILYTRVVQKNEDMIHTETNPFNNIYLSREWLVSVAYLCVKIPIYFLRIPGNTHTVSLKDEIWAESLHSLLSLKCLTHFVHLPPWTFITMLLLYSADSPNWRQSKHNVVRPWDGSNQNGVQRRAQHWVLKTGCKYMLKIFFKNNHLEGIGAPQLLREFINLYRWY